MFNEKSKSVFAGNVTKGFYEDNDALSQVVKMHAPALLPALEKLFFSQRIALIHSELSEALESNRKDKKCNLSIEGKNSILHMDDDEFKKNFESFIKDTEEDEIADTQIRVLDLNGHKKLDLDFHVISKLRYNALRPYKHGKKY